MPDPTEIATWRFEQIAFLLDHSLDAAARHDALRRRLRAPVDWPGADERRLRGLKPIRKPIPRSTLYRWYKAYLDKGYGALLPKSRRGRRNARHALCEPWIRYALGLLYEQPHRSLTQLELYLKNEFHDYALSRSSLARHLKSHPAFPGIERLRHPKGKKTRQLYQGEYPHEGWQLDAKGPFTVRFKNAARVSVHVLSIIDDHSRYLLAATVAHSLDTKAAILVLEKALAKWGLPERFQFDLGAIFESNVVRQGLAQLGIHRNAVKARTPEWQGKIEAYHRVLGRWFIDELPAQEVIDLAHLQQLLEAMNALLYNRHYHRAIKATPEEKLAGRRSHRHLRINDIEQAFLLSTNASSHPKTGQLRLDNGCFQVPKAHAGRREKFLYHPVHPKAYLTEADGNRISLKPFTVKPLAAVPPQQPATGTGQLQKLLDQWRGAERPNAQPGFGLPELFGQLGTLLGRPVPQSEQEARTLLTFYQQHGPLPQKPFLDACARTAKALGEGRALSAYLNHLARQIVIGKTDEQAPIVEEIAAENPTNPTEEKQP